jgi:hypothetical protein
MKKRKGITLGLLCLALCAGAQDLGDDQVPKNKKGNEILPKQGDIGLGFNMIPVIDLVLGTANPSTNYAGADNLVQYTKASNNQIVGKYFIAAKTAVRVRFGFNTLSGTIINRVQNAKALYDASFGTKDDIDKASLVRVEDELSYNKGNFTLAAGLEFRRGYRRLQGFYGAELGFGQEGARQTITYGNAFSDQYRTYYTDFGSSVTTVTVDPTTPGRKTRETETRYRGGYRLGLRAFVGIEYFIFAKISIAAEYGWGYSIATRRSATSTREVYNNGQNGPEVFKETVDTDSRQFTKGFAVDNNNGNFFSMSNTIIGNTALSGGAGALTVLFHF